MAVVEEDTIMSRVNRQMEELCGYSRDEIEGKMSWKELVAEEEDLKQMIEYHFKRRDEKEKYGVPRRYEFKLKCKNGEIKTVLINVSVFPGTNQSIISLIDITTRKNIEERMRHVCFHDRLTGLYNRTFFEESIKRVNTKRQLPVSIIMGDVNGLKLVNDGFGHQKGDTLLKKIAGIIQSSCRKEDIVARWGGDEFVILLPQTERKTAENIMKRVNQKCKKIEVDSIRPSLALGCAAKTTPEQDIYKIFKKAENNMYQNKLEESESFREKIIASLKKSLFDKGLESNEHNERIKKIAVQMGKELNLSDKEIHDLRLLSSTHDLGEISITDRILLKPGPLTKEEWKEVKKHPEVGYRIANATTKYLSVADYILNHHERWDGTGYPRGLKGEEIPLLARIFSIADAFDVMTHVRPYKKAVSINKAINELKRCSGAQFDPELVDLFVCKVAPNCKNI